MARFYASIKGQAKTEATRRGGPKSGIEGHIRGWLTAGSKSMKASKHIGRFTEKDIEECYEEETEDEQEANTE